MFLWFIMPVFYLWLGKDDINIPSGIDVRLLCRIYGPLMLKIQQTKSVLFGMVIDNQLIIHGNLDISRIFRAAVLAYRDQTLAQCQLCSHSWIPWIWKEVTHFLPVLSENRTHFLSMTLPMRENVTHITPSPIGGDIASSLIVNGPWTLPGYMCSHGIQSLIWAVWLRLNLFCYEL